MAQKLNYLFAVVLLVGHGAHDAHIERAAKHGAQQLGSLDAPDLLDAEFPTPKPVLDPPMPPGRAASNFFAAWHQPRARPFVQPALNRTRILVLDVPVG
jgi:hypothetical protein